MADVAAHIRLLGFPASSELLKGYDEDKDNYNVCPSRYPDDFRYLLRAVNKLRTCQEAFGIPSHKLHVAVKYDLPTRPMKNHLLRQVYGDILARQGFGRIRTIRVLVTSKARSVAALNLECTKIRLIMESSIEVHLDKVKVLEQDGSESTARIARRRKLGNQCRVIMLTIMSAIREHHKMIIDQVTQLWQGADEFDGYCLGEFFALAEAW
ncbi:uncharacterized protein M437DRAFT_66879 [Aureobasidium melanogenum CBS 110374]|uniref:Uncharacterized protein n=1 Tax=Aureobasidium melanogenum (strain CBS 110374) TaxID=1043003 RepID=A0A074VN21_AURM1|nr:uncharacterized protein M437DRAFT_66879 [Aureobasidium melanogenum CBS 110374]KEQ61933.1 hypothetical protein M437DRAFT_66879 [Aureobasidium melanogenum CBS 110374]